MNEVSPTPNAWKLTFQNRGQVYEREFAKLGECLRFLGEDFRNEIEDDPEAEASCQISYLKDEPEWNGPGSLWALVDNRFPYPVLDGWAGGQAIYRLGVPEGPAGTAFWIPESADLVLFAVEDLN